MTAIAHSADAHRRVFQAAVRQTDPSTPLVWSGPAGWKIGSGRVQHLRAQGSHAIDHLRAAWYAEVEAHVAAGETPESLTAFGSIPFSAASQTPAELLIPERVLRSDAPLPSITAGPPLGRVPETQLIETTPDAPAFAQMVQHLLKRIQHGEAQKVVLARSVHGHIPADADLRHTILRLAHAYPTCWTFAVDGLIGASPEMLAQVRHHQISSRVLAGTAGRAASPAADRAVSERLLHTPKELAEHAFARDSVREALRPLCEELTTSHDTVLLQLPNVWHLASVIEGRLQDAEDVLSAIGALHPTAAVAGVPRAQALQLITETEPIDRGRYAGAVGWINGAGDGEWALALRCAQFSTDGTVQAWAGCGIVPGSDPAQEFAETELKLEPLRRALSAAPQQSRSN